MNTLKKSIKKSFTSSRARFFSIFLLMMIGSFALVGLKVTGPNMRATSRDYFDQTNLFDISVIGSMGIDKDDRLEIEKASGEDKVEYGYFKDVKISNTDTAIRVFSRPETISKYILKEGEDLKKPTDIILSTNMRDTYKLGDKIKLSEKAGLDGKDVLKIHTYRVVGFADSAEYMSYVNMGPSSAGDGNLSGLAYTLADNFSSDYYMIARIKFTDTENLDPYSDLYRDKIEAHSQDLDSLLEKQGKHRLGLVKGKMQDEIDKAEAKITYANDEIKDKQRRLDEAKSKLAKGKKDLEEANTRLESAKNSLDQGRKTLDEKWLDLASGKEMLDKGKDKLLDSKKQLDDAKDKIDDGAYRIDSGEKILAGKKSDLEKGQAKLEKGKKDYEANKSLLDEKNKELSKAEADFSKKSAKIDKLRAKEEELSQSITNLEASKEELINKLSQEALSDEEKIKLDQKNQELSRKLAYAKEELAKLDKLKESQLDENSLKQYEEGKKILESKRYDLDSSYEKLARSKEELEAKEKILIEGQNDIEKSYGQLKAKKKDIDHAKASYENSLALYQKARISYEENLEKYYQGLRAWKEGFDKLSRNDAIYSKNLAKYKQAKKELAEKEAFYQDGLSEFEKKSKDAKDKIKTGEDKIKDAKKIMASLEEPTYMVSSRREALGFAGYTIYQIVANIVDKLSNIFPVFLYFVASLVTLTTMTRFVDEERINNGTLVALGYDDRDVIKKFTLYGLFAGLSGTLLGIILGHILLPSIVYGAYGKNFSVARMYLKFYPRISVFAIVLSLLSSVLPAYLVAKKQLTEKPTSLLMPKAPAKGSSILLERITPIWSSLGFIQKVTARNIFRYKKRMLMTIFGVAGGMTLLFAGFSVQKSIAGIEKSQFEEIINYDLIASYKKNMDKDEEKEISDLLASKDIQSHLPIHYEKMTKKAGKFGDKQEINLLASDRIDEVNKFVDLRNRKSKEKIKLNDEGVVISERLADILNLRIGDEMTLLDANDVERKVRVSAITEMYAGHFVFMSDKYYKKVFARDYKANADVISLVDDSLANTNKIGSEFMDKKGVKTVVSNTLIERQTQIIVQALNKIMVLIILVATLLSLVILYNLTNINLQERIRELSTVKVLGFYDKEVTMYIYRETIFLTILGLLLGYGLGDILFKYILKVVPPAEVMFNPALTCTSFIIPLIIILLITIGLGLLIYQKLKNVDMLEALKSVE